MRDKNERNINYMRISITDRCNLRCQYCMPHGIVSQAHASILRYEEILRICREATALGINRFKVTGGEPLVRKGCLDFIADLKKIPDVSQVTLTTNAVLLKQAIPKLREVGIDGINISLDTTDREEYFNLTGQDRYSDVIDGIDASVDAGIRTKLNTVLLGENREQILKLSDFARDREIDIRFIELMPIGLGKKYRGMRRDEAREILLKLYPDLHPVEGSWGNGPAVYEGSKLLKGKIGWINAMSHSFCASCNRIRLTSTGLLKPCLCFGEGVDLAQILRKEDKSPVEINRKIREAIAMAIQNKPEEHCFTNKEKISESHIMAAIGG